MGFLWKQRKFPRWHENLGLDNMEGDYRAKHLRRMYTVYHIYMLFWTGDHHGCGFTNGGKGRDLQWLNCTNHRRVDSATLFPRKLGRDYKIRPNFASRLRTRTRSFIDTPIFFLFYNETSTGTRTFIDTPTTKRFKSLTLRKNNTPTQ